MTSLRVMLSLLLSLIARVDGPVVEELPVCPIAPSPGYTTEEELEAQIAKAPPEETCQVDPTTVEITDGPVPSSCHTGAGCSPYHHNGWTGPAGNRQGGQGNFQVKDVTNLPHDGSLNYFVVGRVFLDRPSNGNWAETGWSEVSWTNNDIQRVYTYSSEDNLWRFYGSYSLTPNTYYGFRVTHNNGNARASISWSGSWQLLRSYSQPNCHPASVDVCKVQEMAEIFRNVDGQHPGWGNSAGGSGFQTNNNGTWATWSASDGIDNVYEVDPYKLCTDTKWSRFHVLPPGSTTC